MKDFKPTHKMSHGEHKLFCGGGKVAKMAMGGATPMASPGPGQMRGDTAGRPAPMPSRPPMPIRPSPMYGGPGSPVVGGGGVALPPRPGNGQLGPASAADRAGPPTGGSNIQLGPRPGEAGFTTSGSLGGGGSGPGAGIPLNAMKFLSSQSGSGAGAPPMTQSGARQLMTMKKGGMAKGGNWIAGATKNKGALHRSLGVPQGEKIPAKKLNAAMKSNNPTIAKRARLAETLNSFKKDKP